MAKPKIIRTCTVPQSLGFVTGMLFDLQKEYEVMLLSSSGTEWERVRKEHPDVACIEVEMARHISPLKDFVSLCRLIRVFHKQKPTMVHSMTPKAGLLCMLAAWVCRIPVRVHTFTGLVFPTATGLKQKILIFTDRLTCFCATHIIPEGEGVKNDLVNYHITKKPLKVLGYGNVQGIDLKRFNPEDEEVRKQAMSIRRPDLFTFVFVGRIVGDKGINELIAAFKKVNLIIPASRLILVGKEEKKLDPLKQETLDEIGSNKAIEAVGLQSDVRPWLLASDAFVFPSYREGFPNVVLEAGAMGLPSIVTDINGSREIIQEGVNGTIIPSKDVNALYSAMLRYATDRITLGMMTQNARPLIASRYEQTYVRQCLKDFYIKILLG